MDNPYAAGRVEYDRKITAEHQEKKRKLEAECLEKDRRTAATRLEEDNKRLKEEKRAKSEKEFLMRGLDDKLMTSTIALDVLGLSDETPLTMEDIYAGWMWRMAGRAMRCVDIPYTELFEFEEARNVLLDYTAKHLAIDVSVPPMDKKQAAALLEIPESAVLSEIGRAYHHMMHFVIPPKNGVERYMRQKKIDEAYRVMRDY